MENNTTKPPKYITQNGYLYERVSKKKIREAITEYNDLQEMMTVISESGNTKTKLFAIKEESE